LHCNLFHHNADAKQISRTATREIREFEHEKGMGKTPVVAISAYALKGEIEKSLGAGCDEHLTKPLKKAKLMEMLSRYAISLRKDTEPLTKECPPDSRSEAETDKSEEFQHDMKNIVYVDEDFEDLIPEFFEDARKDILFMEESLNNGDYETVRQLGHSIRGAGGLTVLIMCQRSQSLLRRPQKTDVPMTYGNIWGDFRTIWEIFG